MFRSLVLALSTLMPIASADIPSVVRIDGQKVSPPTAAIEIPDHPGHWYSVKPDSDDGTVLVAWVDNSWKPLGITHLQVFNREQWGSKPRTFQSEGEEFIVFPHTGRAWTSSEWLNYISDPDASPMPSLAEAVAADKADVDVTHYTGSGNMTFYNQVAIHALAFGFSHDHALFLDAYMQKQTRRPRHAIDANGAPWVDPQEVFGPWWDKAKGKPAFNIEWFEANGLNPWDSQHLDGSELHRAYKLTGHPIYLWELIKLWTFASEYGYYLQQTPNQTYAGAARIPGWYLTLTGELLDCLNGLPSEPWASIRTQVEMAARWHIEQAEKIISSSPDGMLLGTYGSVGPAFHGPNGVLPHQKPWQVAVWAWGCQWIAATSSDPVTRRKARGLSAYLVKWNMDNAHKSPLIAGTWAPDVATPYGAIPGTGQWHLPALLREGLGDSQMAQDILATSPTIELAAPAWGLETMVP